MRCENELFRHLEDFIARARPAHRIEKFALSYPSIVELINFMTFEQWPQTHSKDLGPIFSHAKKDAKNGQRFGLEQKSLDVSIDRLALVELNHEPLFERGKRTTELPTMHRT